MSEGIRITDLRKTFDGARPALGGVTMEIGPGEMVALIGASGAGKSTLLRHVAGFVAADPGGGRIEVGDQVIQADGRVAPRIRRQRAHIGFVFQQFNLVGRLSVMTNVLTGLLARVPSPRSLLMRFTAAERAEAYAALHAVGIEKLAWQRASTLSGGQQQRVAIARALVQGARVILADEPIASLDPQSARNVMDILARVNREHGITVLVSLHQVEYARRYCARTVALRAGEVVYDGPSAALTREALGALYGAGAGELLVGAQWPAPTPEHVRPRFPLPAGAASPA